MERRQFIASAISAMCAAAANGAGAQQLLEWAGVEQPQGLSDSAASKSAASVSVARNHLSYGRALGLAVADDESSDQFALNPTNFLLARGVPRELIDANRAISEAVLLLCSADARTALSIGDGEYFAEMASQRGALGGQSMQRLRALPSQLQLSQLAQVLSTDSGIREGVVKIARAVTEILVDPAQGRSRLTVETALLATVAVLCYLPNLTPTHA